MKILKMLTKATLLAGFIIFNLNQAASAAIYVYIPNVPGDVTAAGYEGSFAISNFELQAATPSLSGQPRPGATLFSFGRSNQTLQLLRLALAGQVLDGVEVQLTEIDASGAESTYLKYKLERCWIKSWSTSGDADDRPTEEIAFYYNKIAF